MTQAGRIQSMLLVMVAGAALAGCWEDELEVVLNADGSGTVKHTLTWTDRYVIGAGAGDLPFKAMPFDKYGAIRVVGDAMKISDIRLLDLPGGGKRLYLEGSFDSAAQFFLSEYCREYCRLRLAPAGPDTAALACDLSFGSADQPVKSVIQLYGVAKGLRVQRRVRLPAVPVHSNGIKDESDDHAVSWVLDLRDLEGLQAAHTFVEGRAMGVGFASLPASAFGFNLPLAPAESSDSAAGEPVKTLAAKDIKIDVTSLAWRKVKAVKGSAAAAITPELTVGVKVLWPDGMAPVSCDDPVLSGLSDDQGKNLVLAGQPPKLHKVSSQTTQEWLEVKAKAPTESARVLKDLSGYVRVVTEQPRRRVVIEDLPSLAGLNKTGNPVLDQVHFKILAVSGRTLRISLDRGYERIGSINVMKPNGDLIHRRSGSGKDDWYVFEYAEPLTSEDKCEVDLILDEKVLLVPFQVAELELP